MSGIVTPVVVGAATVAPDPVGPSGATYSFPVEPARFSELPQCFELGVGGCPYRHTYLTVGTDAYLWWAHTQDSVIVGPDPGDTEPALSGYTGTLVTLPAGESTAQAHAVLVASAMAGMTGVTSASAAGSGNADGSWSVTVVTDGRAVAAGTRSWASQGARGIHGSHVHRMPRAGEVAGSLSLNITRMVGTRINTPPATARMWAVQLALGNTVSAGAQRPRLQMWASTSTTNPGTDTEALFDFGQIPAAQMVAGDVATIYLTAAQSDALRTAIDGATGTNFWLSAHCTGGSHYNAIPNGGLFDGETAGGQVRVQADGLQDATVANTGWTVAGSSFSFLVPMRLVYDVDPCTSGYMETGLGSMSPYADFAGDFALPDTLTMQPPESVEGVRGARILSVGGGSASGDIRRGAFVGGDVTPDAVDMDGATVLSDVGVGTGAGTIAFFATPTGAGTVRVPMSGGLSTGFKGNGASGRGEGGPGPFTTGRIDNPSSWVRRFGANIGQNPMEWDNVGTGAGYGDDTTSFEDPIVGSGDTYPGNHPSARLLLWQPAIAVTET